MTYANPRRGMFLMLLCTLFWSLSGLLVRMLPWNSVVIAGGRSIFAGAVVYVYMRVRRIPFHTSKKTLLGAVSLSGQFISYIFSSKMTSSANAIVLQQCAPALVLIYNIVFLRARARRFDILTVLLTMGGILLFFVDELTPGTLLGNLLGLLSGVFLAANILLQAESTESESMSGILGAHLLTFAVSLPFVFLYDTPLNATTIATITFMGLVQLGIPYVLYGIATHLCSPLAISLIGIAEAIFNPIWVAILLGEFPSVLSLIGGTLVLGATAYWAIASTKSAKA